jgi:hypothetical protein
MNIPVALTRIRMKRLPLRLRIAHLRALIRQGPAGSIRTRELVALLHDQLAAPPANENRSL